MLILIYNLPILDPLIRLDFLYLVLKGPEAYDHMCRDDQFNVHGVSVPVPTVCGTNTGHHSKCILIIDTSGFETTHVVVSVRHPITYQSPHPLPTSQIR